MTVTSPRLDVRLRAAVARLDDANAPMAETWRKVGLLADELELPRPGYDTVRLVVRAHRLRRAELRELLDPVVSDLLQGRVSAWDVARAVDALALARARPSRPDCESPL